MALSVYSTHVSALLTSFCDENLSFSIILSIEMENKGLSKKWDIKYSSSTLKVSLKLATKYNAVITGRMRVGKHFNR